MTRIETLDSVRRMGVGLAFVVVPLVFIFAFATHPGLLDPRLLGPEELILRARKNDVLQFGHALVTLNTALLVVIALHFIDLLDRTSAAAVGFAGGALAILGSILLAADKGALCLTMSAIDTVSDDEFTAMMPGLLAVFAKQGWMVLVWGIVLVPIGFALQAMALLATKAIPSWQAALFLVGVLLVATPDGVEIVNLTSSILLAASFIPYGLRIILNERDPR